MIGTELSCCIDSIFVGHFNYVINHRCVENIGDESVSDALYLVKARLVTQQRRDIFWFDSNELDVRFMFFEEFAYALKRTS